MALTSTSSSLIAVARAGTFALGLGAALGSAAFAASPSVAVSLRDAVGRSPVERDVAAYPAARRAGFRDLGRYPASGTVKLGLVLRYQHEAELAQLTFLQSQRGSAYYHRYLTAAQWNAYFAPPAMQVARVASYLGVHGFRVTRILPNRTIVDVVGTAASTERLFQTQLHAFVQPGGHGYGYANVTLAKIPAELKGATASVAGLHSNDVAFYPKRTTIRANAFARAPRELAPRELTPRASAVRVPHVAPAPTSLPISTTTPPPGTDPIEPPSGVANVKNLTSGGYGPFAFAASYDEPDQHGYDGVGQNVGNVISGDFLDSDLKAHETEFGITRTGSTFRVPVDVNFVKATNTAAADVGESTLDVETILGLVPAANYYEYLVNTLADLAIEDGYNRVVNDDVVSVANSSFGGCETDDPSFGFAVNYIAMQGAAKGITFNASTGDTGGNGCGGVANGGPGAYKGVAFPSVAYYFTAVGGTDLVANPTSGARVTEAGWETGGGGVSTIEALPSWQSAAVGAGVSPVLTGRNVPDVAFDASLETGYDIYQGGDALTGGTSLASPIFAATQTMINEVQGTRHGWVNPRLYQIYGSQGAGYAFFDEILNQNQDYVAGPGYDNVTGLGSIQGFELAGEE